MTDAYNAVVFDCDGVLVEPTDTTVLVDAVVEAFDAFEVDIDRSVAQQTVSEDVVPTETAREHGINPEAFWHYRELTASLAQQSHVREGGKPVYDDVAALEDLTCPIGMVSNNQHVTIEFLLAYRDLPAFETARGRRPTLDGAAMRKPEPDYIEAVLADLDVADALYVGDSEKDVIAARRAEVDAAYLRREHVADVELTADPTFEVSGLHELVERVTAAEQSA